MDFDGLSCLNLCVWDFDGFHGILGVILKDGISELSGI